MLASNTQASARSPRVTWGYLRYFGERIRTSPNPKFQHVLPLQHQVRGANQPTCCAVEMPQTSLDYLGSICGEVAAPQWFPHLPRKSWPGIQWCCRSGPVHCLPIDLRQHQICHQSWNLKWSWRDLLWRFNITSWAQRLQILHGFMNNKDIQRFTKFYKDCMMVQASQLWLVSLRHGAPLLDDPQQSPAQRWEVAIHSDKGHTSTQCPVQRGCLTNWCEHTKAEIPWYHEIPWNNTGGLALLETGTNTWWLAKKVTKHGKHCLEYSGYVRCCDIRFFNAYLGKLCIYQMGNQTNHSHWLKGIFWTSPNVRLKPWDHASVRWNPLLRHA